MANSMEQTTGFMSLPREIRDMIYKFVLHIDSWLACPVIIRKSKDQETYYMRGQWRNDWYRYINGGGLEHMKVELLRVSQQIYYETRRVLCTKPVRLTLIDRPSDLNFRNYVLLPGKFRNLYSIFGHLRHVSIQLQWMLMMDKGLDHDEIWKGAEKRDSIKAQLRSLLPPSLQNGLTALRSLTANLLITPCYFTLKDDHLKCYLQLLEAFITDVPAIIDVSLTCWTISEKKSHARFGNKLVTNFAAKRVAHVARVTQAMTSNSNVEEIEDEGRERLTEPEISGL